MKLVAIWTVLSLGFFSAYGQMISIEPAEAEGDDEITITFTASEGNGELVGADKVYCHLGVVLEGPDGTTWQNVVGNWGQDDGVGEMTAVSGQTDVWQLTLSPSAREYTGTPTGTTIFRLSMVFRSADGGTKGTLPAGDYDWGLVAGNQDNYVDLKVDAFVNIKQPAFAEVFLVEGDPLEIRGDLSGTASTLDLTITEGSEVTEVSQTDVETLSYDYVPQAEGEVTIAITAVINGITAEASKTVEVNLRGATNVADLPAGLLKGINYHEDDDTKATLVLEAPGKDFVYVVGDFTNWEVSGDYQMNVTDDGELFWLEISDLTPGEEYVFQYWVNGTEARVGDPYADKVADPWNDSFIPEEVYPSGQIPEYTLTDFQIATVLQTNKPVYEWAASEETWERPAVEELVVYELLIRDFMSSHSYTDLIDTLDYLVDLGVNAVELMPIMEFEGNSSWGYNPMYFFAVDKYYGTSDDLKKFIETAHQKGIAVILDMVLNHAFGLNAMVKMYWDPVANTVSDDSPWFNPVATHPFNVGFDFNHTSSYTKDFVDTVNHYWINEYHFDGYRFDLSKGFTQFNSGDDVGLWSSLDRGRVDLLTRMKNAIRQYDDDAYIILEHFADQEEEDILAANGMIMWRNMGGAYHGAMEGNNSSFAGADVNTHVSYMESHDEQRLNYQTYNNGRAIPGYDTRDTLNAMERHKMAASFFFTLPGPKMLWQFGELGYDIDINFNGRVGEKPVPWGTGGLGYYENEFRQHLLTVYRELMNTRKEYSSIWHNSSTYNMNVSGPLKYISIDNDIVDFAIVGNFGLEDGSLDPNFTHDGTWYDYFSGEEISVSDPNAQIDLAVGEFHVYTDSKISDGFEDVIEIYSNPVSISPASFGINDEITITFDATLADPDGTNGLVGASEVFLYSGVIKGAATNPLTDIVDDGAMTRVDGETDIWTISLTPKDYYGLDDATNVFRIGMYFRDASNNLGKGFRGTTIFAAVNPSGNVVAIDPRNFDKDTEITITFDAGLGGGELANASSVYMHSGVVLTDTETPSGGDWSNTVGTWGADDGVGQMTKVSGDNPKWQITLTPSTYYSLGDTDEIFWISMVFRTPDGSIKGTGVPNTSFENGTVDGGGDIYMKVTGLDGGGGEPALEIRDEFGFEVEIYPNPSAGLIKLENRLNELTTYTVYSAEGKVLLSDRFKGSAQLNLSNLQPGAYFLKMVGETFSETRRVIIK